MKPYIGRISTVERDSGSHRIATFTESNHAPECYVGDPALLCTASGDGEQTIGCFLTMLTRMEGPSFLFCDNSSNGRASSFQVGGCRFESYLSLNGSLVELVTISHCHCEGHGFDSHTNRNE
jgi:hypothetical protein